MEEHLKAALNQAILFLEQQGYHYAIIGGLANQLWGRARFTYDIDIKVLVPDTDYATVGSVLRSAFSERARPHTPENPLIVDVKIGAVAVDFLLAIPGYEENIITRANQRDIDGLQAWICSAEDLIIQKAAANRSRDWDDIEGILVEQQGKLDYPYIHLWLKQFAEALERPEIESRYRSALQRASGLHSRQNNSH